MGTFTQHPARSPKLGQGAIQWPFNAFGDFLGAGGSMVKPYLARYHRTSKQTGDGWFMNVHVINVHDMSDMSWTLHVRGFHVSPLSSENFEMRALQHACLKDSMVTATESGK